MKKITYLLLFFLFIACDETELETEESITTTITTNDVGSLDTSVTYTVAVTDSLTEEENPSYSVNFDKVLEAYVKDPSSEPTNVRHTPNGVVMLKLSNVYGNEVVLKGVTDGWFLIKSIWGVDNDDESFDNVNGYIHGSVLAVDTRNYGNEEIYLFDEADETSEVVAMINEQEQFSLLSTTEDGLWVKVKWIDNGRVVKGWIQSNWLCGSSVTLCS